MPSMFSIMTLLKEISPKLSSVLRNQCPACSESLSSLARNGCPACPGFSSGEYEVIGVVRHSETLEPLVLYRPLYNDSGMWVRPFSVFHVPSLAPYPPSPERVPPLFNAPSGTVFDVGRGKPARGAARILRG